MKKHYIIIIGFFCFIQLSCNNGFEPANFAIHLKYPDQDSNCEEGIEKNGSIIIPFKWAPQGNQTSFTLILNNEEIPIEQHREENGFYVFDYPVKFNKDYKWQIISEETKSNEERAFRTPRASENINNVPLAVKFDTPTFNGNTNSMKVTFTWEGGDADLDGNLKYDAYLNSNADISTTNNIDRKTNLPLPTTEFTITSFNPNKEYYLLVVAKDDENEAYSILKFKQF